MKSSISRREVFQLVISSAVLLPGNRSLAVIDDPDPNIGDPAADKIKVSHKIVSITNNNTTSGNDVIHLRSTTEKTAAATSATLTVSVKCNITGTYRYLDNNKNQVGSIHLMNNGSPIISYGPVNGVNIVTIDENTSYSVVGIISGTVGSNGIVYCERSYTINTTGYALRVSNISPPPVTKTIGGE